MSTRWEQENVARARWEIQGKTYWPEKRPRSIRKLHPSDVMPGNPVTTSKSDGFASWYTYTIDPPDASIKLDMELEIPAFGVVIMNPTEEARNHAAVTGTEPEWDQILTGTFIIKLPEGVKKLKYKRVKVGLRCIASWRGDIERSGEDDILFETEMVSGDDQPEGNVIEGEQRFQFSIPMSSSLPVMDRHAYVHIRNIVYGVVEGLPGPEASTRGTIRGSFPGPLNETTAENLERSHGKYNPLFQPPPTSKSGSKGTGASLFRLGRRKTDRTPSEGHMSPRTQSIKSLESPTLSMEKQENLQDGIDWLVGEHIAGRPIRNCYNPNPDGGVNTLNEYMRGSVAGLGQYEIRCWSDVWTISSILKVTLAFVEVPPTCTIFCFRVTILQTHHLDLSRTASTQALDSDAKTITTTFRLPIIEEGEQPGANFSYPDHNVPALWRGVEAGGKDKDVVFLETVGRAFNDTNLHLTTPKGLKTPLRASHQLEIDVYFSIHGETAAGKTVYGGGPGEMRVMRLKRDIIVPSCALMPEVLNLPNYGIREKVTLGHISHTPSRPWDACACYLTFREVEDRMAQVAEMEEIARIEREGAAARKAQAEGRALASARGESFG